MPGQGTLLVMKRRVGLIAGMLIAACTGGGSVVTSMGGGSSGAGGARGDPGIPPGASSPPGAPYEMPVVTCSPNDGGLDDGGADAEAADAESPQEAGSPQDEVDAGADGSPCSGAPPPDCISATAMVVFHPGPCDGRQCVFGTDILDCPGGCCRQMDGGIRCNE